MNQNRFQDFFETGDYLALKNSLYNYRLRKRAIAKAMDGERPAMLLEVGSGISPVVLSQNHIVYSDLSFTACRALKQICPGGHCVVADATRLPFKSGAFSHAVSSEVLEHLVDDNACISELSRVIRRDGRVIVTFPHRKFYWANDDTYIEHQRRYELPDMQAMLNHHGLRPQTVQKVLGPLEKITMMAAVLVFHTLQKLRGKKENAAGRPTAAIRILTPFWHCANAAYAALVALDAAIMPRALASCLLIKSEKK